VALGLRDGDVGPEAALGDGLAVRGGHDLGHVAPEEAGRRRKRGEKATFSTCPAGFLGPGPVDGGLRERIGEGLRARRLRAVTLAEEQAVERLHVLHGAVGREPHVDLAGAAMTLAAPKRASRRSSAQAR